VAAGWRRCGVTKNGLIVLERKSPKSSAAP
jgi:hypothetical protein